MVYLSKLCEIFIVYTKFTDMAAGWKPINWPKDLFMYVRIASGRDRTAQLLNRKHVVALSLSQLHFLLLEQ
jgi:hypothetical protein